MPSARFKGPGRRRRPVQVGHLYVPPPRPERRESLSPLSTRSERETLDSEDATEGMLKGLCQKFWGPSSGFPIRRQASNERPRQPSQESTGSPYCRWVPLTVFGGKQSFVIVGLVRSPTIALQQDVAFDFEEKSPAFVSIFGRPLDMVDHQHVHGPLGRHKS
jgi:hypothetical protein